MITSKNDTEDADDHTQQLALRESASTLIYAYNPSTGAYATTGAAPTNAWDATTLASAGEYRNALAPGKVVRISRTNARRGKKTMADVQKELADAAPAGTTLKELYAPARTTSLKDTFDRNGDDTTIEFYPVGTSKRAVLGELTKLTFVTALDADHAAGTEITQTLANGNVLKGTLHTAANQGDTSLRVLTTRQIHQQSSRGHWQSRLGQPNGP